MSLSPITKLSGAAPSTSNLVLPSRDLWLDVELQSTCTLTVLSLSMNRGNYWSRAYYLLLVRGPAYWNEGGYAIVALIRKWVPHSKNTFELGRSIERRRLLEQKR